MNKEKKSQANSLANTSTSPILLVGVAEFVVIAKTFLAAIHRPAGIQSSLGGCFSWLEAPLQQGSHWQDRDNWPTKLTLYSSVAQWLAVATTLSSQLSSHSSHFTACPWDEEMSWHRQTKVDCVSPEKGKLKYNNKKTTL